jgi:hypothetical protein
MNCLSSLKTTFIVCSISVAFSQQSTFWFKADPSVFSSTAWSALSNRFELTTPVNALSASRNPELQKVYEVNGKCDLLQFKEACASLGSKIYSIERGPEYTPLYVPNDLNSQAGISDYALMLINAPQAWDLTQGDNDVVIAVSDQNFDVNHQDLEGKYVYYDPNNNLTTTHGTAVAITAAGKTNNGYGLSSIGFNTSLALYKMNFNEVLAASYAGADVINISWSSGCFFSQLEQDVIEEAAANGSFIVASAGNGNTCGLPDALVYPASYNHVFSVTSVGPSDNHEQWAGDPTSTHNHNDSVDLAAPGYDVAISPAPGWYLNSSGTSFAAAYVSGTVALMLAANECISNLQIESILKSTSFPLDGLNVAYAGLMGAGRLDAFQAVSAAQNSFTPLSPSVSTSDGCEAGDAAISVNIQGGQAPYNINWSNGFQGLSQNNLGAGSYFLHVVDIHGCRLDTLVVLADVTPPNYSSISANPTCSDSDNGMIQLNILDANVTVFWSQGSMGPAVSNLSAGNHQAFLHYGANCVDSLFFTLTAPQPIQVSAVLSPLTASNLGAIDLTVSGGTAPYSFMWNNNASSEDLLALHEGTYTLWLTDANGCAFEGSYVLESINDISAEAEVSELVLSPNPNNGVFNVVGQEGMLYHADLHDAFGRKIWAFDFNGQTTVETELKPGEYFLSIQGLNAVKVFKMIRL